MEQKIKTIQSGSVPVAVSPAAELMSRVSALASTLPEIVTLPDPPEVITTTS